MFARYAGSRFAKIDGGEVRILNDDEILAKIKDPEDIQHLLGGNYGRRKQVQLDLGMKRKWK